MFSYVSWLQLWQGSPYSEVLTEVKLSGKSDEIKGVPGVSAVPTLKKKILKK